ncbi:helix-turn-helix domain-containing protein [Haloplanus salilacus]|uniref:helix-turn-helix domain-containing protein n=1 Tax=Haloplanus salilacus TaxID=2949994 RepID=UPI0030D5B03D
MPGGVRAELAIHGPENCPLATLSERTGASVTDVTWAEAGDGVAEEFRIPSDADIDVLADADADAVVDIGEERVYRFDRDAEATCPCDVVESLGSPLADVRLRDGTLRLTLHPKSVERLRTVVAALNDAADTVELRYLVHTGDGDDADRSVVDWSHLTDRQREVLRTAHEMGYFEYPRRANATAVADELDIGLSTFTEHLTAAQGALLDELLPE